MSEIHLSDLSKIYKEQIVEKKDDSYLEPDMKKRQANNEKARKEMAKVKGQKNPHFEEKQKESDIAKSLADAYRAVHEEGYGAPGHNPGSGEKSVARAKALMDKKGQKGAPGLDAMRAANKEHEARRGVKKEELELDENRRAARAAGGYKDDSKKQNDPSKAGFTGVGNMSIDQIRKMSARMDKEKTQKEALDPVGQEDGDIDNDGDKDKSDKYLAKRRKAIGKAMKKESLTTSDWRNDLSEVMTDDIESKPIKEKKVNNKVTINPKLGEAIEELGGTLLEEIEVDELDIVVEEVYDELIEEGYDEDDVESAIEQALIEASVTMGHDTEGPKVERTRDKLKKKAKGFLGKVAVKAYNKAREAKAAAAPAAQRAKTSAKRGIKKLAQKVVDRMSEEIVSEAEKPYPYGKVGDKLRKVAGERDAETDLKKKNKLASRFSKIKSEYDLPEAVYGGTQPEKKDTRMVVTNADKKANTPAYQKMKAGDKRYKSADHMDEEKKPLPKNKMFRKAGNLGRDVVSPSVSDDQRQKAYDRSKKIIKTMNKANEEVEVDEAMMAGPRKDAMKKKEYSAKSGSDRATAFNIGTRRDVSVSDPKIKSRGGRTDKRTGEGDRGMGNAAKRRMKEDAAMSPQEIQLQKKKAMLDRMIAQKRQQGLNKANKTEAPAKAMGEETEDSLKDRRMERGGVDGNNRYNSAPKNVAMGGGKKKPYDGMSALEKVKASIRAKHGQGAIMDTKKK